MNKITNKASLALLIILVVSIVLLYPSAAVDTDNDGMPDAWEQFYGLDALDPGDADVDGDLDGLSNLNEYLQDSHPRSVSVSPNVETDPLPAPPGVTPPADDVAIWVHPVDTMGSRIVGTDKQRGLAVYDMAGGEVQFLTDGKMINVDLRYNFILGSETVDLVVASNRTDDSIAIYKVERITGLLSNIAEGGGIGAGIVVYGSCMFTSPVSGKNYVFVNSKLGEVEQWELVDNGNGLIGGIMVRAFDVGTQTEGCVVDDEPGALYIGEEDVAIWRYGAEPAAGMRRTLVDVTGADGHLTADVEGLGIYHASNGSGYLVASSQGSSEYVLYQREAGNKYVGTFKITPGNGIGGASSTDGIDVSNIRFGSAYPEGVFIAHDHDDNNFKLVPWQTIANAFSPQLIIDTSWNTDGGLAP